MILLSPSSALFYSFFGAQEETEFKQNRNLVTCIAFTQHVLHIWHDLLYGQFLHDSLVTNPTCLQPERNTVCISL